MRCDKSSRFVPHRGTAQLPNLCLLRKEQMPEAISFQGRENKHREEWYHARTDDRKLKQLMIKCYVQMAFIFGFPMKKTNDGQTPAHTYNSPVRLNSPRKLEMHRW